MGGPLNPIMPLTPIPKYVEHRLELIECVQHVLETYPDGFWEEDFVDLLEEELGIEWHPQYFGYPEFEDLFEGIKFLFRIYVYSSNRRYVRDARYFGGNIVSYHNCNFF